MTTQPSYVLMPAVATEEMLRAAFVEMNRTPSGTWKAMKAAKETPRALFEAKQIPRYAAMVAARPHPAGELREAVARVIEDTAHIGYSINLTRLVDGVSTYTVTPDGYDPREFPDHGSALDWVVSLRRNRQADAIIALLNAGAPPVGEGEQGVISSVSQIASASKSAPSGDEPSAAGEP